MNEELKKLYDDKTQVLEVLCNKKSSLKDLNKFDLALLMKETDNYKEYYDTLLKKDITLDFEELFNEKNILERYLVFKLLGDATYNNKLGCQKKYYFDCDKSDFALNFYNLNKKEKTDTLLSIQSILGKLYKLPKKIEEVKDCCLIISKIKKRHLYDAICRLIIYYHTIGNISPCPSNDYNRKKGRHFFDRLDIFKESDDFNEFETWYKENLNKYKLDNIYNGKGLLTQQETIKLFSNVEKNENEIEKYIESYIDLIIDRTKELYE